MSRIRVAIAGAGIGGDHLRGYLANPELFDVVSICDLDEARATRLIGYAHHKNPESRCTYSASYEAGLERDDVDLMDICLPPGLHKAGILNSLAAGKHVVCEKPLVRSVADADEVIAAAQQAATQVFPIFQYRFGNGIGQLCELIRQGLAGKPLVASLETHWRRDADYYDVPWRGKWATELGGAIVGHAIHAHDLLVQVLGPVATVQATLATRANDIEVEDCGAMTLQMQNGALATSSITLGHTSDESRLRFCFSELSAESGNAVDPYNPGTTPWIFTASKPKDQPAIDAVIESYVPHKEGFARQLEMVHGSITEGTPPPVTLQDARGALALISGAYQSNKEGKRVDLTAPIDAAWYNGWVPE